MGTVRQVVVVATHGTVTGGAEFVAIESALALAKSGIEVTFLSSSQELDPRFKDQGVRAIGVPKSSDARPTLTGSGSVATVESALSGLRSGEAVIHIHGGLFGLGPSGYDSLLSSGHPTVATLHDYGLACPNSGFYLFPQVKKCPYRALSWQCVTTQCSKSGWPSKLALTARTTLLTRKVRPLHRLAGIVGLGPRNVDLIRPYADPRIPIYLVENPYLEPKQERVNVAKNEVIISVGRLTPEKDPVALARAARESDFPIVFVGSGPLEAEVRAANPQAEITGWVGRDEVVQWFRRARAHAMASRWWEGSPMALTDALAQGIPCIVPEDMSGAERIKHGENGFSFRHESPETLTGALDRLRDPATADRLGANAYAGFWDNPPTLENHIAQLIDIYNQTLG